MQIERRCVTFYIMAIVMFILSVIVDKKFAIEMYVSLT